MFAVEAVYTVAAASAHTAERTVVAGSARVYTEVYTAPAEPDTAVVLSFYLIVYLIF
jgi:hypothetical protein